MRQTPGSGTRRRRAGASIPRDHDGPTWRVVLDQMTVGVTVVEVPTGRFILQNSAARQILGRSAEGAAASGDYLRYGEAREAGPPYEPHEYPLTRALLAGEAVEREPMYYRRPDGRLVVLEVNASRVTAPDGRQLGVCTFQDVSEEYERRRALKEAAERVQLALDAGAIVGTWVWDLRAGVMTADELFAHSFGLDPERCRVGLRPVEAFDAVHPDDRPAVREEVYRVLAQGGPYQQEYRVRRREGGHRWVEASGRVELDEAGRPVRFPGVLLDVTAWKQADEARTLLMREVDHRARNALAMVQSVVRLTDSSDPARYRQEVVGRVDAMARAQASLSRTNWEGGVLRDVVGDELSAYVPEAKFTLEGRRVTLPADQVQPLGMIVHEMVTNSVKYGALSTPAGRVEVCWAAAGDGELELSWTERGGPPVGPPRRKGFGSRLIERLAVQLGGSVEMDWRRAGLTARLKWRL